MKAPGGHTPAVKKPVTTSTMKRVGPPRPRKSPQLVSPSSDPEALIEALRERVNDLETRIAELESVISLQNQDVIISAPKSVLIQGQDTVELSAGSKLIASAALAETNAPLVKFSGIVQCDVIQANTVIGASYTPGAGNIW
ncbi:hypothetical protein [Labrenzia sp. VG12]|uniref:hypothetical protein n=1 Tax=Labrenzia sp. VG12 TaxID=2021862 RepID=UPI0012FD4586|nr:hypothetical protein [Labrenzia sp. VG12]